MVDFTPELLLQNSALIQTVAPWCTVLENLELGIVLVAQPSVSSKGLRRSDFERSLAALGESLPIGPTYFQRVNRAVAELEKRGVLRGTGDERDRRFVLTPEGFAALILNLHVLRADADPTLDGSEFELKRELAATWNLLLDRLLISPPEGQLSPDMEAFFGEVVRLTISGRPVVTADIVREAFDVLRLIDRQRERVVRLKTQAELGLEATRSQVELLRNADLSQLDFSALGEGSLTLKENPVLAEVMHGLLTSAAPILSAEARIIRYDAYLGYLDHLKRTYAKALKVVDIATFRRRLVGAGV